MSGGRHDRGQATAELALALPVVVLLLLVLVHIGLVVRDQVLVVHAAREAARAAAVEPTPTGATRAARRAARVPGLKAEGVVTETRYQEGHGSLVLVTVRYDSHSGVPLVSKLVPPVRLEAQAAIRDESDKQYKIPGGGSERWQDRRHKAANPPSGELLRSG